MEEKSELGDIILNKNQAPNKNKKIALAVATLGVILIIVVILMNTFSSSDEENLPKAVLPPKPQEVAVTPKEEVAQPKDQLFEDVEVVDENLIDDDAQLEAVARKLKAQTQHQVQQTVTKVKKEIPKKVLQATHETTKANPKKIVHKSQTSHHTTKKKTASWGHYYVQVGSFTRYEPNKKFLRSITARGYAYKYHKVTRNGKTFNKVLVGPFKTETQARKALKDIKAHIIAGAFIIKL